MDNQLAENALNRILARRRRELGLTQPPNMDASQRDLPRTPASWEIVSWQEIAAECDAFLLRNSVGSCTGSDNSAMTQPLNPPIPEAEYDTPMTPDKSAELTPFEKMLRHVARVPGAVVKAKIEAERAEKKRKPRRASASRVSSGKG